MVTSELETISPPSTDDQGDLIWLEEVEAVIKRLNRAQMSSLGEAIQSDWQRRYKVCKKAWQEELIAKEWTRSILVTIPKIQYLALCKWVMDTEQTRQRQADGIQDEMLQANPHQMATNENEWGDSENREMPAKRSADDDW